MCIQKGYLAQHLKQNRAEVYRLMLSYFKTLDASRMDRIDYAQRVLVNALLKAGRTDEEIINVLTGYFKNLSEDEAKAILEEVKEHPNEEDW